MHGIMPCVPRRACCAAAAAAWGAVDAEEGLAVLGILFAAILASLESRCCTDGGCSNSCMLRGVHEHSHSGTTTSRVARQRFHQLIDANAMMHDLGCIGDAWMAV